MILSSTSIPTTGSTPPAAYTYSNISLSERVSSSDTLFASIPRSEEAVEIFARDAIEELDTRVAYFLSISERNFDNTIRLWHEMISSLSAKQYLLLCTSTESTKAVAQRAAEEIGIAIQNAMQSQEVLMVMLDFAESKIDQLSPSERMYVYNLLKTLDIDSLEDSVRAKAITLEEQFSHLDMLAYTYLQGDAAEKIFEGGSLSVLNLNTCFFRDRLPMLWGGALPWELRIDRMVDLIKQKHPNLICLQEVFDEKAAVALYEKLRDTYRYFYININPKNAGLSSSSLGISSGLFVASEYPIEDPEFIAFGENSPPERAYGFFHAKVTSQGKALAHVVTTHLQPAESEEGRTYREKQMTQITAYMQETAEANLPSLLVGDLNTEWRSKEPAEKIITENFFNASNQHDTEKSFVNRTCCEYSGYWWQANRDLSHFHTHAEIIDYALLLNPRDAVENRFPMTTVIVPTSDIREPEEILSDHQALITYIEIEP